MPVEKDLQPPRKRIKLATEVAGMMNEEDPDIIPEIQALCAHNDDSSLLLPTDEQLVQAAKSDLYNRMGGSNPNQGGPYVYFFLEKSPKPATCRYPICKDKIKGGSYRVAVHPGDGHWSGSADFYHVKCFEELVDFSQVDYLDRIQPVTQENAVAIRGHKPTSVMDGNYLLDVGAKMLVLEWKMLMKCYICLKNDIPLEYDLKSYNLRHKCGSASYEHKAPTDMPSEAYLQLCLYGAPIESDGPEDQQEWNLFEQYIPFALKTPWDLEALKDHKDLDQTHSLSRMLAHWSRDKWLVYAKASDCNEKGKELKANQSEKAVRAIRRLSSILL